MDSSIIICTHNRAHSLERMLGAVVDQDYVQGNLEILVVDNGSTDRTQQVAESFMSRSHHPIRYLYEPKLGLSTARNCGVRAAQGAVVIFIDDDAFPLSRTWAAQLAEAFGDAQVGAAGGDLQPLWPQGIRPEWLHDFLVSPLGLTDFDLADITELHYPDYPWGANLSFRKELVEEAGGFLPDLGWSAGKMTIAGDESELCLRLEKAGKKIVYVPGAAVQHMIFPEKLVEASLMERGWGHGLADASIDRLHASRSHILLKFLRKCANVALHAGGTLCFSCLRRPKMQLFCRYNVRFAAAYVLRTAGLM